MKHALCSGAVGIDAVNLCLQRQRCKATDRRPWLCRQSRLHCLRTCPRSVSTTAGSWAMAVMQTALSLPHQTGRCLPRCAHMHKWLHGHPRTAPLQLNGAGYCLPTNPTSRQSALMLLHCCRAGGGMRRPAQSRRSLCPVQTPLIQGQSRCQGS